MWLATGWLPPLVNKCRGSQQAGRGLEAAALKTTELSCSESGTPCMCCGLMLVIVVYKPWERMVSGPYISFPSSSWAWLETVGVVGRIPPSRWRKLDPLKTIVFLFILNLSKLAICLWSYKINCNPNAELARTLTEVVKEGKEHHPKANYSWGSRKNSEWRNLALAHYQRLKSTARYKC